ncbi:MAG: tRNA (N(6)-L-threonylcarbamoyladenosine(37)-C(2))-methylthiotransferase MtaB [Desulfobacteraceae bacterium]|nr:MAG: tRNA (N(6)-L-threonylcarbamoyladenosine(37)-C(2))-methylthiotransferase MtaB [Desulfobacteraceae bacterium]
MDFPRRMKYKYKITTLGCKVNQFESEAIGRFLEESGWGSSVPDEESDVVVINTCTVTQKASMQSRQAIRQAIRSNPNARIVVTGCYAQNGTEELKQIKGIHDIIGSALKHRIPQALLSTIGSQKPESPIVIVPDIGREEIFKQTIVDISGDRTRPFLKIQDGCDAFCTYCIVPYTRGRSRSMPAEDVLRKIELFSSAGYKEVVLTGIHLGCYGRDFPTGKNSLFKLLKMIEDRSSIDRVRFSSIEPHELTTDIVELVASSAKLCNHFHIPLQSGDDTILKKMKRPYTGEQFGKLISFIHQSIPDAAIGVDVLIGFPGETRNEFQNTYQLIQELPVSYLHVFPYSSRKGTPAARYPNPVPQAAIKERCRDMRELGIRKKNLFFQNFIGRNMVILVEEARDKKTNLLKGITANYITVLLDGPDSLKNSLISIQLIEQIDSTTVLGILH